MSPCLRLDAVNGFSNNHNTHCVGWRGLVGLGTGRRLTYQREALRPALAGSNPGRGTEPHETRSKLNDFQGSNPQWVQIRATAYYFHSTPANSSDVSD